MAHLLVAVTEPYVAARALPVSQPCLLPLPVTPNPASHKIAIIRIAISVTTIEVVKPAAEIVTLIANRVVRIHALKTQIEFRKLRQMGKVKSSAIS